MRTGLLLALTLFTPVIARPQPEGTNLQAKLNARVAEYGLSANGLADALVKTAKHFELPLGIEWLNDKETLRGLRLTWKDDAVDAILRSVVGQYPGYTLQVEHGVVHVFRPDLVNDRHNFLNLRVPNFFEVHQEEGGFVNQRLRAVVQDIVSPRNVPPGGGEGFEYATGVTEKPLTLTLGGLTVRDALDKLVEASEHKVWVVTFSGGSALTPTGFFRTETLWHPTPFPDTDQPMWDFLAWGQYLPNTSIPQRQSQER